jgi:hypothetical protein
VKLGMENRKQMIAASVLGVLLLLVAGYEFTTFSSTNASTTTAPTATGSLPQPSSASSVRPAAHHNSGSAAPGKKEHAPQSLDPTLHLDQLAMAEEIKYEGSGRNIFVAQAEDVRIPTPGGTGATDQVKKDTVIQIQPAAPPPPIPLKFFGFASHPGEAKKIFLSKGPDDVFIAGEGEIVDRRYKVVRISSTSVEMQDLVVSGPVQNIPLTQEKP